jgi:hypothetical protein
MAEHDKFDLLFDLSHCAEREQGPARPVPLRETRGARVTVVAGPNLAQTIAAKGQ